MTIKYTKEVLEDAVKHSFSFAGVLRYLGLAQAGGTQFHIANKIKKYNIDYSHFTGQSHNRGKVSLKRKSPDEILIIRHEETRRQKAHVLRRALKEIGVKEQCNRCSLATTWNNKPIVLEINHINGNWKDDTRENLEFLCPNCHSQEDSTNRPHRFRKINGYEKKSFCECGEEKLKKSKRCKPCHISFLNNNRSTLSRSKAKYPDLKELLYLVKKHGYSKVGRNLGVSDNAVRKRIKAEQSKLNEV